MFCARKAPAPAEVSAEAFALVDAIFCASRPGGLRFIVQGFKGFLVVQYLMLRVSVQDVEILVKCVLHCLISARSYKVQGSCFGVAWGFYSAVSPRRI